MSHSLEKIIQDLVEKEEARLGRPFGSYKLSVIAVRETIDKWMKSFEKDGERDGQVPTISSLAYDLGIARRTLVDYKHRDAYKPMLERAKTFTEMHVVQKLFDPKVRPAGPIFNLKANYGWKDGSQLDVNINIGWNEVQKAAQNARRKLEDTDYVPDKLIDV